MGELYLFCRYAAASSELDSALPDCDIVSRVKIESAVAFHCDVNCTADNLTHWYYYKKSGPVILHSGQERSNVDSSKSPRGVTVSYDQAAAHSVLKIEKVTANNTGTYECSITLHADDDDGCKMFFCLKTGEHLPYTGLLYRLYSPVR